jgi:mRNA interferase RelE/StbE
MYKVELSREAQKAYDRADRPLARKLARCFASLEVDPRAGNNVRSLQGPLAGSFRYRVGDIRVLYSIDEASVRVLVITIVKRSDAYK